MRVDQEVLYIHKPEHFLTKKLLPSLLWVIIMIETSKLNVLRGEVRTAYPVKLDQFEFESHVFCLLVE